MKFLKPLLSCIIAVIVLSACQGSNVENSYPKAPDDVRRARNGKLTGEGGLLQLGGNKKSASDIPSIGVNGYLWRATLDTIAFMPLVSADPFGGVIITDWYEDPATPGERFKLNILILGGNLRADGVKVSVFKQAMDKAHGWRDKEVNPKVARNLEDKILTRARQLRINRKAG